MLENAGDRLFLRCERQVSLPPLFCALQCLLSFARWHAAVAHKVLVLTSHGVHAEY